MNEKREYNPEEERKIARTKEELPPLKKDHVRLVHVDASGRHVEDILNSGLDYSKYGMIDSTARVFGKEEDVTYSMTDRRFNVKSAKAVIFDMPISEYRLHRDITKSPGRIDAQYIVGVVDSYREEADNSGMDDVDN